MTEQQGFPLPAQLADVPGAGKWRSMYQYFTRFQPDDDKRFWFCNSMDFPEPIPAFDSVTSEIPYQAIGADAPVPPHAAPDAGRLDAGVTGSRRADDCHTSPERLSDISRRVPAHDGIGSASAPGTGWVGRRRGAVAPDVLPGAAAGGHAVCRGGRRGARGYGRGDRGTMKLMNSVHAGTRGRVAEICLENAEPVDQGSTLMWIEP